MRVWRALLGFTVAVAAVLWPGASRAADNRLLSEVSATGSPSCPTVTIRFDAPVRYLGHTSPNPGNEARLRIEPTRGAFAARDLLTSPRTTPLISRIAWERDAPDGPTLIMSFASLTRFEIALGHDNQTIVLNLENTANSNSCFQDALPKAKAPMLDPTELQRLQAEAEDALLSKNDEAASAALDRILEVADNPYTPRAMELRGIVYERRGQIGLARQQYQELIRRYPDAVRTSGVQTRLADLADRAEQSASDGIPKKDDGGWRRTDSGTLSQFYSRDVSRNRFLDARRPDLPEEVDRRINIDQLLTALDVETTLTDGRTRINARASGSYTHDFRPVTLVGSSRGKGIDTNRIYSLYVDVRDERTGFSGRIGRQPLFGSGVFGRFDGARLGWHATPAIQMHVQTGFPVPSTRTDRVDRDRWFYGLSVGYAPPDSNYEIKTYWFDQRNHGLVDRRSIGVEGRYSTPKLALFGVADLDLEFGRFAYVFAGATVPLRGGGTFALQADQQYYPPLSLTNAVIGQPVPRIEELKREFDRPSLRRLAEDRSARSRSMTMTLTQPVSLRWTANFDFVVAGTARTPASAGVEAVPGSGTEIYTGGQMVGNGIFVTGDTLIGGIRYASTSRFHIVAGDLAARVPFGRKLGIEPRLRVTRRTDKFGPGHQTAWRPNLRATYELTPRIAFDAEVGMVYFRQRQEDAAFTGKNKERATLFNIGYRLSF
jgi:hypothetical protein